MIDLQCISLMYMIGCVCKKRHLFAKSERFILQPTAVGGCVPTYLSPCVEKVRGARKYVFVQQNIFLSVQVIQSHSG